MSDVPLPAAVRISDDVVFRAVEGESVLLNLQSGIYFGLDSIGTRIWQLIDQHTVLSTVLDEIVREFEVDRSMAARDLGVLVEQLAERGLVEIDA